MTVASVITVDRTSPVPLYFQLAQSLQSNIENGNIPAGSLLGNEIRLADELGVSRPTIRRAIEYLVSQGLLVRRRGVGTQVVRAQVRRPLELTSLYEDLSSAGKEPRTDVLAFTEEPAPDEVADALRMEPETPVLAIQRLRYAHDEPIAILVNYLPVDLVSMTQESLEQHGLYELMRGAGVHIHLAEQTIGARNATSDEARRLNEKRSAALLTMTRIAFDMTGRPIEFGQHVYRASRYAFSLTLVER
ncbi:MAG: GntR family transcriptional regulator [Actinomycetales bacterium]